VPLFLLLGLAELNMMLPLSLGCCRRRRLRLVGAAGKTCFTPCLLCLARQKWWIRLAWFVLDATGGFISLVLVRRD
jgi:hypothetical protein